MHYRSCWAKELRYRGRQHIRAVPSAANNQDWTVELGGKCGYHRRTSGIRQIVRRHIVTLLESLDEAFRRCALQEFWKYVGEGHGSSSDRRGRQTTSKPLIGGVGGS